MPTPKKPRLHLKPVPVKGYKKKPGCPKGAPNKNKKTVPLIKSTTFENSNTYRKPDHKIHKIKKSNKRVKSEKNRTATCFRHR